MAPRLSTRETPRYAAFNAALVFQPEIPVTFRWSPIGLPFGALNLPPFGLFGLSGVCHGSSSYSGLALVEPAHDRTQYRRRALGRLAANPSCKKGELR